MPNINLRDNRNRDALVRADSIGQSATVHYVDKDGAQVKLRKVLKATAEHSAERLLVTSEGDEAKLAGALTAGDPDVDLERIGMFLTDANRVYVNAKGEIAYQIQQVEIVRSPTGEVKERRPRRQQSTNVDGEIPISWTGKLIAKSDALRKFVFSGKLQIMHVNGLTYDFLYGMAKELAGANSLMLLGAGKNGKEPLIFRRGSTPHRGFLEGRIDGDKYVLLLHLSKMELKQPVVVEAAAVAASAEAAAPQAASAAAQQPVATPPVQQPVAPPLAAKEVAAVQVPATLGEPPTPHKPTVAEVLAATAEAATPTTSAKEGLTEQVTAAKAAKQRKKAATVNADATTSDPMGDGPAKTPRAKRATPAKPPSDTPS